MNMTIAEAMAMAVIRGDRVAAYALADALIEERSNPTSMQQQAAAIHAAPDRRPVEGYEVFHWPEFRAFARRLGLVWDLYTQEIMFTLKEGELVIIKQNYVANETRNPHEKV